MFYFFFFKQKTAYEMRISDWSSDVCSSDLHEATQLPRPAAQRRQKAPPAFRHLFVEMGEEGAGQVADALRVEEIELHETFDRALPRPLGELYALRDLAPIGRAHV